MEKEGFTKYEVARILGARALQLSMGAPIALKLTKPKLKALLEETNYNTLEIAKKELEAGVIPLEVVRS